MRLSKLKGIGPYTAGAIAGIAFGLPEPAVDGNVMRVLARLFEVDYDIGVPTNRKIFQAMMEILIDPVRPGDFNQALMDLGSILKPQSTHGRKRVLLRSLARPTNMGPWIVIPLRLLRRNRYLSI